MKKRKNFITLIILIFSIVIAYCINNNQTKYIKTYNEVKIDNLKDEQFDYEKCLISKFDENEVSDNLLNKQEELNQYLSKYNVSIFYEDISTGFNYKYQSDKVYYGASLIKLVEAEYLIDKAINNEIDLDNTFVKYYEKYKADDSIGMSSRKISEDISLKDLISYILKYSDNTAHYMLIDYIGMSNLKKYGNNLGAINILTGGDTYGNQSAIDTNIYLKHAYEMMNSNTSYGTFLKECMTNTYYNYLNLNGDDNNVAHKWGWHSYYFHDIGIVFEEYPYTISILTSHGKGDYQSIVNNIHKKINELHHLFYAERENYCKENISKKN